MASAAYNTSSRPELQKQVLQYDYLTSVVARFHTFRLSFSLASIYKDLNKLGNLRSVRFETLQSVALPAGV